MIKFPNMYSLIAVSSIVSATSALAATVPTPYMQSYSPTSGAAGTVITVTGHGFTGLNGAWVGAGHDSTVYVVSDTVVKVTVPADATTGKLALHNTANWSWSPNPFVVSKSTTTAPPTTTPTPAPTTAVAVSGTVSGASNASVQLSGASTRMATANSNGAYAFSGVTNGTYTVAPTTAGHVFTPASIATKVSGSSVSGISFSGVQTSAATYSITGTVSGATTAGVNVTLNGVNVGSAATDQSGNYKFDGLAAGTYTVSASLSGHTLSTAKIVSLSNVDSASNNFTSEATPAVTPIALTAVSPLPTATIGTAYSHTLVASVTGGRNGTHRYQSGTLASGTPPLGMIVNPNGNLTGTPNKAGTYTFDVCAADTSANITTDCASTTITVTAASTGTTPPPVTTPPVTTPPVTTPPVTTPAAGTSWVYYNGAFDWPGDYSFVASANYADTTGSPLSGSKDIKVTLQSAYGGWLPYAQNWSFNSKPYTKLTLSLKPTISNQVWNVYFVKVGDIPVGISVDPAKYGPAPVAGKWGTYTIPLADLGVLGTTIYKFAVQDKTGLSNNSWYVDNVGFVP